MPHEKLERAALSRGLALERSEKAVHELRSSLQVIDSITSEMRDTLGTPIPRNPFAVSFVEPGSGLRMYTGHYYLLSDSGSSYASTGFANVQEATRYAKAISDEYHLDSDDITVPTYTVIGGWDEMSACNVLLADDLLDFWKREDLTALIEAQSKDDNKGRSS